MVNVSFYQPKDHGLEPNCTLVSSESIYEGDIYKLINYLKTEMNLKSIR